MTVWQDVLQALAEGLPCEDLARRWQEAAAKAVHATLPVRRVAVAAAVAAAPSAHAAQSSSTAAPRQAYDTRHISRQQ